jgi:hypothetical protein
MSRFISVAACLAAFMGTCLALHSVLPPPDVRDVTPKLRFFAAHKDEFDTIFVGSSHIHYGISPVAFDEALERAGIPNRSFNFGADAMYPPERFHVLEQILAMKPRKLKRLFLEMDDIEETHGMPDDQISQRAVYWHDWKRTQIILRKILDTDVDEPWRRKLRALRRGRETIAAHLALLARNVCNVGRAFDLSESFDEDDDGPDWELGPKLDGYVPLATTISGDKAMAFENELARERSLRLEDVVLDRYAAEAYRHYARQIHAAGATPVFLVTPVHPQFPSKFPGLTPCLLLAYNDPVRYPDLYRSDARMDENHLNPTGADKFTRLVAEDFLKNQSHP